MATTDNLTDKERIARLEIAREDDRSQMATKEDVAKLNGDLKIYIAEVKADILKWQFGMWFATIAIVLAAIWRFGG